MALELPDGAGSVGGLHGGVARIWSDQVAALLQLECPIEVVDLDLTSDALGALPPFQFHGGHAELLQAVLGDAEPGVLDVHLDEDIAVALLLVAAEQLDAALHVGSVDDLAVLVEFESGVDSTHVFAADYRNPRDCGSYGKVLPVLSGDLSRAEGAGKDRNLHLHLVGVAELGLRIDHREQSVVGIALDAVGQPLRAKSVTLDVEVGVVDRVVLVAACGDLAERARVDDLSSAERSFEHLAVASAPV